ncbi:glycerol-3-phosphate dehydrogenase (NAD(P)+) [Andreprevotia lacus DSM 23236]|jgi:glycerol-3-phosphate dehydrogenase (NAD(P)+)|uniref:Glycerol-3-phosphate dehydrogenase [NAD(P)+] n=1 Tax=Andreprevotia lacus DSM 23236 TaxID=1121001 RepID=A0A1W1Y0T1_9NEIS|nr:NAD(P)H-dependent glycerol-3-phosphate dehydrogenase [Andreprevotia lacus]SMC29773.1 glycerol-3-phosphate dehydrogenase (NAD(P)+) [Andreprevotia lacus DSM 23236]
MKLAVLGAGAWGTALAIRFAHQGNVALWCRDAEQAARMAAARSNPDYLPNLPFPDSLSVTAELADAVHDADSILIVTPMAGLRPTLQALTALGNRAPVLWACKGLEAGTMKFPHQVAEEELDATIARGMLSGPSFAQEVAAGKPAAVTIAASDAEFARRTVAALNTPVLRLYASDDLVGVEIGAAVKNVLAIAAGVCDGLNLGLNARAALLTRGLVEMARFGAAMGAKAETFMGLAGIGDLMLTATGDLSRNRRVGLLLAQGLQLDDVLKNLGHVAEGVPTAREVLRQADALGIDMPITRSVCKLLFNGAAVNDIISELMERAPRMEGDA